MVPWAFSNPVLQWPKVAFELEPANAGPGLLHSVAASPGSLNLAGLHSSQRDLLFDERGQLYLRHERQLEGVGVAKARGVYKGRKPSIDVAEVRRLCDGEGLGPTATAKRLGTGRASVYRVLGSRRVSVPPQRPD